MYYCVPPEGCVEKNMYTHESGEYKSCITSCYSFYHIVDGYKCVKNTGLIVGVVLAIVVGCLLCLAGIIVLIVCLRKRAVAKKAAKKETKMREQVAQA